MSSIGGLPVDNGGGIRNVGFGAPQQKQGGNPMVIVAAVVGVIALVLGVMAMMFYGDMTKAKNTVNEQVDAAVTKAKEEQKDEDWEASENEKRQVVYRFNGPVDYGTLSFDYRKDWSVYINRKPTNTDSEDFEAFLNLRVIPPVDRENETNYSLRVYILNRQFPNVYDEYAGRIKDGMLKESRFDFVAGRHEAGVRLDGLREEDREVHMVMFKLRDKTAIVRTDGSAFLNDFEAILATLDYIE